MSNFSEDEWSLVSDDEILSESSYDEFEAEPEAEEDVSESKVSGSKQELSIASAETIGSSFRVDETEVLVSLLADSSVSKRSTEGYSSEIRVSLLSPVHQGWFAGPPHFFSAAPSTDAIHQKSTKVAFCGPAACPKSFPHRLRALVASMCPLPEDAMPPTYTEVTTFKKDQSTQVTLDVESSESFETRAALLQSALDRTMGMAKQLHIKSQDNERLSLRIAELESSILQAEEKLQHNAMKIKLNERSLALAKQQTKLTTEYQDNLKRITEDIKRKCPTYCSDRCFSGRRCSCGASKLGRS
ncbi:unnamed protein product [Phytophthora fragariaefolia]|uniref:Unnamed protein product n=1 Tax=Phytophthora fragariaefolia TaxID=1490495 RepID=A0A9W6Y100_9STRA|nr:unnamed protein product [Phytophthora fragariaefolia]